MPKKLTDLDAASAIPDIEKSNSRVIPNGSVLRHSPQVSGQITAGHFTPLSGPAAEYLSQTVTDPGSIAF
jgi:hypothetical protein